MTICAVNEYAYGGTGVAQAELCLVKIESGHHRELRIAVLAFENIACRITVDRQTAATRAIRSVLNEYP